MPGSNYKNAGIKFKYKISKNSNSYSGNLIDYFHKKFKDSKNNEIKDEEEAILSVSTVNNLAINAINTTTENLNQTISNFKKWLW